MMWVKIAALTFTALILIPSGAHLFELPAKIRLDRDAYFIVQGIYTGWAAFVLPIIGAIAANCTLFAALRRAKPTKARWALLSAGLIVGSLAVFFAFVFPGNEATENWTAQPENWDALRHSWEYGHAANAVLVFAAFIATAIASVEE
jgi:hypothetical protein